jgi:uncharacterized protein
VPEPTGLQVVGVPGKAEVDLRVAFAAAKFCAVKELPRTPEAPTRGESDDSLSERVAGLTGAYLSGDGVVVGWKRHTAGSTIDVFVGGDSLVKPSDRQAEDEPDRSVNLPPGCRGDALGAEALLAQLRSFACWQRVKGIADSLSLRDADGPERRSPLRPSLEDTLTTVWREPFAWLVVALPIPLQEVERQSTALSRAIPPLRAKASNSQEHAVNLERQEARYRELQRAELSGLWDIHVFAAAEDPDRARQFGALLCSCFDLDELPYTLKPAGGLSSLEEMLDGGVDDEDGGTSPFDGSTDLLASIASPPRIEVPGVRMRRRPSFDITPETHGDVPLGVIMDASLANAGLMTLSRKALNRHTFVCGATGSGKSQTIRGLLEELSRNAQEKIPWLVIEPAKAEYRGMSGRLEDIAKVIAIRPGTPDAVAGAINPLQPEPGFPLQTHVDLTRALFLASFQSQEPFPQVLSAALTRCYEDLGWDLALGEARAEGVSARYPTLGDLQRTATDVVRGIGYGQEVARNIHGFVDVRLSSLRHGTPGRFFEGGHPLDIGALLKENVVLEIEDLGDDQDKAFLMGSVIVRLVEHLRVRAKEERVRSEEQQEEAVRLRHVTVIEEAHRLLRRTEGRGPAAHAVELFASLLAEVRAYGEGIIIAEQIPSKIIPDVIKNTAVKVVHRLPARDDREAVGATMNLTDAHSEYVVSVTPGAAAVFTDGMDYPALVRMGLGEDRENDDAISIDPPLAGRFSAACSSVCQADGGACTLREMRMAQRLLEDDGRVLLWVELVLLAHITGMPSPSPGPKLRQELIALERRTLDCALAHAVEAGVGSRAPGLSRHYSPASLTRHVAAVLQSQLEGKPPPCSEDDHWTWQAGPFRWNHVFAKLEKWKKAGENGSHPETDSWKSRFGLQLDAKNRDAQVAMLVAIKAREAEHRAGLVYGRNRPSGLETAVDCNRTAEGWAAAMKSRVQAFAFPHNWRWTEHYLKPERSGKPSIG